MPQTQVEHYDLPSVLCVTVRRQSVPRAAKCEYCNRQATILLDTEYVCEEHFALALAPDLAVRKTGTLFMNIMKVPPVSDGVRQ